MPWKKGTDISRYLFLLTDLGYKGVSFKEDGSNQRSFPYRIAEVVTVDINGDGQLEHVLGGFGYIRIIDDNGNKLYEIGQFDGVDLIGVAGNIIVARIKVGSTWYIKAYDNQLQEISSVQVDSFPQFATAVGGGEHYVYAETNKKLYKIKVGSDGTLTTEATLSFATASSRNTRGVVVVDSDGDGNDDTIFYTIAQSGVIKLCKTDSTLSGETCTGDLGGYNLFVTASQSPDYVYTVNYGSVLRKHKTSDLSTVWSVDFSGERTYYHPVVNINEDTGGDVVLVGSFDSPVVALFDGDGKKAFSVDEGGGTADGFSGVYVGKNLDNDVNVVAYQIRKYSSKTGVRIRRFSGDLIYSDSDLSTKIYGYGNLDDFDGDGCLEAIFKFDDHFEVWDGECPSGGEEIIVNLSELSTLTSVLSRSKSVERERDETMTTIDALQRLFAKGRVLEEVSGITDYLIRIKQLKTAKAERTTLVTAVRRKATRSRIEIEKEALFDSIFRLAKKNREKKDITSLIEDLRKAKGSLKVLLESLKPQDALTRIDSFLRALEDATYLADVVLKRREIERKEDDSLLLAETKLRRLLKLRHWLESFSISDSSAWYLGKIAIMTEMLSLYGALKRVKGHRANLVDSLNMLGTLLRVSERVRRMESILSLFDEMRRKRKILRLFEEFMLSTSLFGAKKEKRYALEETLLIYDAMLLGMIETIEALVLNTYAKDMMIALLDKEATIALLNKILLLTSYGKAETIKLLQKLFELTTDK